MHPSVRLVVAVFLFFFFQAEDGIRDIGVTGVQTCALPIFPTGITGSELTDRATLQANKFGARLSVSTPVSSLMFDKTYPVLRLDGDETVTTKCLLIATGVEYRRLNAERCEQFEGRGVYYAATHNQAQVG